MTVWLMCVMLSRFETNHKGRKLMKPLPITPIHIIYHLNHIIHTCTLKLLSSWQKTNQKQNITIFRIFFIECDTSLIILSAPQNKSRKTSEFIILMICYFFMKAQKRTQKRKQINTQHTQLTSNRTKILTNRISAVFIFVWFEEKEGEYKWHGWTISETKLTNPL